MRDSLMLVPIFILSILLLILGIKNGTGFAFYLSVVAVALGIITVITISGLHIFGVGLNETATIISFKSAFLIVFLWPFLSLGTIDMFLGAGMIGIAIYSGMTLMYVIGFFLHIRGGTE